MPLNHSSQYANLTNEQFALIGKVVVEWSNIEFLMGVILSRLLCTPDFLGRVYSDEMSAFKMQSALLKAVEIHRQRYLEQVVSSEILDSIIELNTEIEAYRSLRNKFSHFCWMRTNDDEIWGTRLSGSIPSKKNDTRESKAITVPELEEAHQKAYQLVEKLSEIIELISEIDEDNLILSLS